MAAAGEFGLAFQLMDDQMDQDALAALPAGAARSAMEALTDFVLSQRPGAVSRGPAVV